MTRARASATHLAISAALATLVFLGVYFVWYPGALFDVAGGKDLLRIMITVDVIVGPLLTLVVFKPGKPGLAFDLAVIAVAQLTALGYGLWAFAESRPVYIAFVKDRFELARANEIPDEALLHGHMSRWRDLPWTGPKLVGVRFPTDADEKFRLMVSGMAGADIQCYPQYHVPYDSERAEVRAQAQPVADLLKYNKGLTLEAIARERRIDPAATAYLPMRAGKSDLTVFVDRASGNVVDIAHYRPWQYQ